MSSPSSSPSFFHDLLERLSDNGSVDGDADSHTNLPTDFEHMNKKFLLNFREGRLEQYKIAEQVYREALQRCDDIRRILTSPCVDESASDDEDMGDKLLSDGSTEFEPPWSQELDEIPMPDFQYAYMEGPVEEEDVPSTLHDTLAYQERQTVDKGKGKAVDKGKGKMETVSRGQKRPYSDLGYMTMGFPPLDVPRLQNLSSLISSDDVLANLRALSRSRQLSSESHYGYSSASGLVCVASGSGTRRDD